MSNHQNIEELFRSKLGNAELNPSKGAWKAVQRQLRIKNFLRFDPARFNIWYLGALLVAGAVAVTLLSSAPTLKGAEAQREAAARQELQEKNRTIEVPEENRSNTRTKRKNTETRVSHEGEIQELKEKVKRSLTEKSADGEEHPGGIEEAKPAASGESETTVRKTLLAGFTTSLTEGCAPLQVEFLNSSVNAVSVSWSFGNGEVSEEVSPVFLYEEPGTYAVAMRAVGVEGDTGVFHQVIRVHPKPVAGFEMSEGLEHPDGSISMELMNYSTGGYAYSWDLLSARGKKEQGWTSNQYQPIITNREIPEEARQIRMVVLSEQGCTDTAVAEIAGMSGAERSLLFPTVFSANLTGPTGGYYSQHELRRDIFHPHYSEEPAEYQLRIYSKMGEIIFETRDIRQGWDGYYRQDRSAGGVYLWVAEGTWQNGTAFNQRGDVTLLWGDRY